MLTTGTFPDDFKLLKVISLFKKGDFSFLIKYRPISLSPHTPLIFVFMLLQSLLSISKVHPSQYTWHSLTLAKPLTKLVTGHFLKK